MDWNWRLGILLNYACELLNLYALSKTSPILLSPLGIISVLVNMSLGSKILNEKLGFNQKLGYGIILLGVVILLLSAQFLKSIANLDGFMYSSRFIRGISVLMTVVILLSWYLSKSRMPLKAQLVAACSMIGGITMVLAKIVTTEISQPNKSWSTNIWLFTFSAVAVLYTCLQEYFKQQAMKLYDISSLVPEMYLGYNVVIIASCGYFYQKFNVEFLLGASISLSMILMGIRIIKRPDL